MMRFVLILCVVLGGAASAGVLEDTIASTRDGRIRFDYATRPGVFGDGKSMTFHGTRWRDWECDCSEGPARAQVRVRDGEVIDVDVHVGGRWRAARAAVVDVGTVPAAEAAAFLLSLAESASGGDVEDAILGAVVADGFSAHDRLIGIARDDDRPRDIRESAIFWLGQAAGEHASAALEKLVDDEDEELSVREHAIFALSQRSITECFEPLSRIARTSRHPQLREKAFFWLAQHDDPRVIALFEDVLLDSR